MKRCRDCAEEKPFEDFSPSKKNADGRVSYCRPCMRTRTQRYDDSRRGGLPQHGARAHGAGPGEEFCPRCQQVLALDAFGRNRSTGDGRTAYCRDCHNATGRQNRERLWGTTREYQLRRRYGITGAEYDAMVEAQGGLCALCRLRAPEHVDHDHLTGTVRGASCSGCDQGLGDFRDDPGALRQAGAYVERHREQQRPAPRWLRLDEPALDVLLPAPRPASRVERWLAAALVAHRGD